MSLDNPTLNFYDLKIYYFIFQQALFVYLIWVQLSITFTV